MASKTPNETPDETHRNPQIFLLRRGIRVQAMPWARRPGRLFIHPWPMGMGGVGGEQKAGVNPARSTRAALCVMLLAATLLVSACSGVGLAAHPAPGPLTPVPPVALATPTTTSGFVTLLNLQATTPLPDGSNGVVRLTGANSTWSRAIPAPLGKAEYPLLGLVLIITTGNDDLRGGTDDNADVVIHDANVGDVPYTNVNKSQHWNNGEFHYVFLIPTPPSTTIGDVQSITIVTHFSGGISGDNWDIAGVELDALYQF